MARTEHPWSVPVRVQHVPETGRNFELSADASICTAVAEAAGVNGLKQLDATFELSRHGRSALHVVGRVSATVRQTCVVTLEPIFNDVIEPVDLMFAPGGTQTSAAEVPVEADDPPEPIIDGMVDLGAIATEFLILAIDPYPRKPGAVFEPPRSADQDATPFAALAALKKNDGGSGR